MSQPIKEKVLDRFAVLSVVSTKQQMGLSLRRAISETAKLEFEGVNGKPLVVSERTIYRWFVAYKDLGLKGISPKLRESKSISKMLPSEFVEFMEKEKKIDPDASIPEIIRRSEIRGVTNKGLVNRTTAWRVARKLNLPLFSDKQPKAEDMRRFSHPHRMQLLLCDGKHFRVGSKKRKRVVLFFLDDSTRKVITAVVGKSETSRLFSRGLFSVIEKAGLMEGVYLDRGSGFTAKTASIVCARLGVSLIHGRARYPPGRGKIEKFNQTCLNDLLRGLAQDPLIDTDCQALEHRINHYLTAMYNVRPHEGIEQMSPNKKWQSDTRDLKLPKDMQIIRSHFIVSRLRHVSRDNIVMMKGGSYEMPTGYAGQRVEVYDHILDGRFSVLHEGRHLTLKLVDLTANARSLRRKRVAKDTTASNGPIKTAAQLLYEQDHKTIVGPDGDYYEKE
jgi:transposase InsO family protein